MQNSGPNIPDVEEDLDQNINDDIGKSYKIYNITNTSNVEKIQNLDINNQLLLNEFCLSLNEHLLRKNFSKLFNHELKQKTFDIYDIKFKNGFITINIGLIVVHIFGAIIAELIQYGVGKINKIEYVSILVNIFVNSVLTGGLMITAYCVYTKFLDKKITQVLNDEESKMSYEQFKLVLKEKNHIVNVLVKQKQAIVSYISYEIRNLLQGSLYALCMLEKTNLPLEQKGFLKQCILFEKKIEKVLDDALKLQRLELVKEAERTAKKSFTFDKLIDALYNQFQSQAIAKNLQLICYCNVDLTCVFDGDSKILAEILHNLVSNAIKFSNNHSSSKRGFVKLIIRREKIIEDELMQFHFAVQDIGVGMSNEQIKHLFLPYNRTAIKPNNLSKECELSLGLYAVQLLLNDINQHNFIENSLGVTSLLGKGSIFWFRTYLRKKYSILPLINQKFTVRQHKEQDFFDGLEGLIMGCSNLNFSYIDVETMIAKNMNVLVIEDTEVNKKIMEIFLTSLGCNMTIVNNNIEAISAIVGLDDEKYNIIFMNLEMQAQNNFEIVTVILKQLPFNTPIIGYTSDGAIGNIKKCLSVGVKEIILQPITFKKIMFTLNKIFTKIGNISYANSEEASCSSAANLSVHPSNSELLFNFNSQSQQKHPLEYCSDNEENNLSILDVKGKSRVVKNLYSK